MKCRACKEDQDKVIDSRPSGEGYIIRRRRECLACGRRYTTYERAEERPLKVVKKNGSREQFDRNKIHRGLEKACEKLDVSAERLEEVADEIELEIRGAADREVTSQAIGDIVMKKLKLINPVAYIRFASVYKAFQEIEEFSAAADELNELKDELRQLGKDGGGES